MNGWTTEPRYILWKKIPAITPGGKARKVPINWMTGGICSAHDRRLWTTCGNAAGFAKTYGPEYGVGLVVEAPHVLLDLDKCLVGGQWSDLAQTMMARFAGAYMEISTGGEGIHIIALVRDMPHHACKRDGLELYSTKRFVALTGTGALGSMDSDQTSAFHALVQERFLPSAGDIDLTPAEWTTEPSADWAGPADDDELITRMLASQSAAAAFGGRAPVAPLWNNDGDVLGKFFPATGGDDARAYDGSKADAALAAHILRATGRDCERTLRVMERSALVRPKWERDDYLRRTIMGALKLVSTRYRSPDSATAPADIAPRVAGTAGMTLASDFDAHFAGVTLVVDRMMAITGDGRMLAPHQFKTSPFYGGSRFRLDSDKTTRNAWEAFTEASHWAPPCVDSLAFRPELPAGAVFTEGGSRLLNSYYPAEIPAEEGDVSPFLDHLRRLLPDQRDRDLLTAYLAALVQYPGAKFSWWPLIVGVEGNGKSFLGAAMRYCIGDRYTHSPNAQDIANKFNGWIENRLLLIIEEITLRERFDSWETLKMVITNPRIELQRKGADQIMCDNRANGIMFSNHLNAVRKTANDRRIAVFECAQREVSDLSRDGMTGDYFPGLYNWLRSVGGPRVLWHLRHHVIPDDMNPATAAHRAPATTATAAAIAAGRSAAEQSVLEAVATEEVGFRGGWISSHYLRRLLDDAHVRVHWNGFDGLLRGLGYVRHQALADGRVNGPVLPEGKKSSLWVRSDCDAAKIAAAIEAADAYQRANAPPFG